MLEYLYKWPRSLSIPLHSHIAGCMGVCNIFNHFIQHFSSLIFVSWFRNVISRLQVWRLIPTLRLWPLLPSWRLVGGGALSVQPLAATLNFIGTRGGTCWAAAGRHGPDAQLPRGGHAGQFFGGHVAVRPDDRGRRRDAAGDVGQDECWLARRTPGAQKEQKVRRYFFKFGPYLHITDLFQPSLWLDLRFMNISKK